MKPKKNQKNIGADKIFVLINGSQSETIKVDLSNPTFSVSKSSRLRHLWHAPQQFNSEISSSSTMESGHPSKRQRTVARARSLVFSHDIGNNNENLIELAPFQFAILSEESIISSDRVSSGINHQNQVA